MYRVGLGIDAHYFEKDRALYLGGIKLSEDFGLKGHSDGDALLHAITDAILGALSLGDIGEYFPDTNIEFKNAESKLFLYKALELMREKGFNIVNLDCTIITDKPKISPIKGNLIKNLSKLLSIEEKNISIKAKTKEGFCEKESLVCHVIILLSDEKG